MMHHWNPEAESFPSVGGTMCADENCRFSLLYGSKIRYAHCQQQELTCSDIMEQSVAAEFEFGRRDIPKAPPIDAGAINRQVEVEGVSSAHDCNEINTPSP